MIGALLLPIDMTGKSSVSAVEQKQSDLIEAMQTVAQRMGLYHGMEMWNMGADGGAEMTWTMVLPSEDSISQSTDQLARQIIAMAQNG